jgi:tetratricopeptide (TPR) repeat protein
LFVGDTVSVKKAVFSPDGGKVAVLDSNVLITIWSIQEEQRSAAVLASLLAQQKQDKRQNTYLEMLKIEQDREYAILQAQLQFGLMLGIDPTAEARDVLESYQSLIQKYPNDVPDNFWSQYGALLLNQRPNPDLDKVIEAFTKIHNPRDTAMPEGLPQYMNARYDLARAYALKGDKDKAIAVLEKALRLDKTIKEDMKTDKDLESLRSDPRFKALLRP